MHYFREHVADDYYSGGFDGDGELLMLVHGQISPSLAATFVERLQRVGQDFAQQHLAEQKLRREQKRPYTLVVGMRSWLFARIPRPEAQSAARHRAPLRARTAARAGRLRRRADPGRNGRRRTGRARRPARAAGLLQLRRPASAAG